MNEELPPGWISAPIADVTEEVQPGFASGEKNVVGGIAHLRMNNIGLKGELVLDLVRTVPKELARPHHDLHRGDVLVCTTNSGKLVGKCAYFDLSGHYVFSNHLTRLRPVRDVVDGRFLCWSLWLLWSAGYYGDRCKHWVNQSTIPREVLLETEVAIPPLAEQHRIAAKLEKLLGKVDACQKRLAKIPILLKRFRQSVLAAACSGRLTADWREECSTAVQLSPPPSVELLSESESPEDPIPASWAWTRFESVIEELRNGVSPRPNTTPPGIPVLRISAVRAGTVDLEDVRYMPKGDDFIPAYALRDGDLLFTRYNGSLELLGACGMVRNIQRKVNLYPDKLMRVRFKGEFVLPSYAEIFFQTQQAHDRIVSRSKSSAGQNGISGGDLRAQPLALPPVVEQMEIVRRVEALVALVDQIEARYAKAQARADQISPSLLAKAFRGELVPQDPNDEPATVRLERMNASRSL